MAGLVGRSRTLAARLAGRAFPGSRLVWAGGLAVVLVSCVVFARFLSADVASLTGTNSVATATVVADLQPGEKVCVRDLLVPSGTARVEVWLAPLHAEPNARIDAWLAADGRRMPLSLGQLPVGGGYHEFALAEEVPRDLVGAAVCLVARHTTVALGGASVQRLPGSAVTTLDGRPLDGRDLAVRFRRPFGDSPSMLDALGDALDRAAVFEPGLGVVLLWLALPGMAILVYLVRRVAATAESRTIRRLAALAAIVAFVHAAAWAVLLHPFHGADEPEHFAYAQHLAATNDLPDSGEDSTRPPYSSSQLRLMGALHHSSTVLNRDSRPRWEEHWEQEYNRLPEDPDEGDGGGYTVSGTGHSPLYYFLIGLPYRVAGDADDLPSILLAMRLLNALFASLVAALAVLTASTLFGGRHNAVAWLAGVLAGLQPVYGSVAAAVNNDTALNVAAAAALFLLVRAWARGPTLRSAAMVGLLAIILPVSKVNGFALLPVVAVAVAALGARHGLRPAARWGAVVTGSALVTAALWVFAVAPLIGSGEGKIRNEHPSGVTAADQPKSASEDRRTAGVYAAYFQQMFVPWVTIGDDRWDLRGDDFLDEGPAYAIYIERGYGLFGWKSTSLAGGTERGIFYFLLVGWLLAVAAAVRHRDSWRSWLGGGAILVAAVLGVLALVSYAFTTADARAEPGEQGRYVFPALVALAVLFSTSVLAFRDRIQQLVLGVAATWASCLAMYAWAQALRGWFV